MPYELNDISVAKGTVYANKYFKSNYNVLFKEKESGIIFELKDLIQI